VWLVVTAANPVIQFPLISVDGAARLALHQALSRVLA